MLLFRIAREIGGMTVAELSDRITTYEVAEWDRLFVEEAAQVARAQRKAGQGR